MLTSRLDAYISRYGNFCAHDNDDNDNNDTADYFTPCACAQGNNILTLVVCLFHSKSLSLSLSPPLSSSPTRSVSPSSSQSAASTTHLIRNNYERNHPTTLPVGGCNYNGHTPTSDIVNTPTPTIQSRLLPSTPDDHLPMPLSTNHTMMATINEEMAESANQYAHLGENVPLEMQQNNSSAVDV